MYLPVISHSTFPKQEPRDELSSREKEITLK